MIAPDDSVFASRGKTLVCICVPTYNVASTVRESLESILRQSYRNIVVRVSDNASTDDTLAILELIDDERLTIHRQETNIGAEGNFTRCIELATGKYTAIFHADDVYEPGIVAKQVEYLEGNADVSAVFTEATTIDECGIPFGVIGAVPGNSHGVRRLGFVELLRSMLLYNNYLVCPSAMVRTEIYKYEIKEWGNSLFRSASDVDIWLRLSKRGQIAVLDEPLMRYRISGMQFSYLNRTRTERLDFFRVMDDYLSRPEVRDFLTRADFRHYGWLERHECVARSMNLFALGRVAESRKLLTGILTWDAVHAAVRTRRGFVTLMGLALLRIAIPFGASARVRAIVGAAKRISWR